MQRLHNLKVTIILAVEYFDLHFRVDVLVLVLGLMSC